MIKWFIKTTVLFIVIAMNQLLFSQTVTIVENTPVSFTVVYDPVLQEITPSYENVMGDIQISTDGGGNKVYGKTWYVTVSKSITGWDSNLTLEVRRDPTNRKVSNGTSYVVVPDGPAASYFFESNNKSFVDNLGLQHCVSNIDATISPNTYTTTVNYTIVDL